ncbi:hypothetical protein HMPREF0742_01474 [Rothia aeria F0184]|uniref:Uncharacterized protein n=1 Tax=Rothia aeria F0184 TaxID=888019 RepID=U7V2A8_9MICC|nr:hypothetical protein HMPREF0742_01474 [Rothia aeria F0184]
MKILSALRTELGQLSYSFKARISAEFYGMFAAGAPLRSLDRPQNYLRGASS